MAEEKTTTERPSAAERPVGESGAAALGRGGRMSRSRKMAAVLRLLRGDALSAKVGLPIPNRFAGSTDDRRHESRRDSCTVQLPRAARSCETRGSSPAAPSTPARQQNRSYDVTNFLLRILGKGPEACSRLLNDCRDVDARLADEQTHAAQRV